MQDVYEQSHKIFSEQTISRLDSWRARKMKGHVWRHVPSLFERMLRIRQEMKELQKVSVLPCEVDGLRSANGLLLEDTFNSHEIAEEWKEIEKKMALCQIPDGTGAINPGDRRALYYLIRKFQPRSVLEIGTYIGASTIFIAAALIDNQDAENNNPACLVSVDMEDVNDPVAKPWQKHGTSSSPSEMVNAIGGWGCVEFVKNDSLAYFSRCQQKYDFIFLDGCHAAETVYQEIAAALQVLKRDGVILLHDYFPQLKPLWSNGKVILGPYLATERLRFEGAALQIVPLGQLPWPTKLRSSVTSLALVLRD